ncbi:MAG: hypothetical protein ACYTG1_06360 [Planctomycetota bacterium]
MTARHERRRPERPRRDDDLLGALGANPRAPDLTRSIMGRLGYMPVGERVARRRLRHRLAGRASLLAAVLVAGGIGVWAFRHGPTARGPAGPTLPAALGNDLEQHQTNLDEVLRVIRDRSRDWLPSSPVEAPAEPASPSIGEDADRSAVAPVRWV